MLNFFVYKQKSNSKKEAELGPKQPRPLLWVSDGPFPLEAPKNTSIQIKILSIHDFSAYNLTDFLLFKEKIFLCKYTIWYQRSLAN